MWVAKHDRAVTHLPWYFRAPFFHFWSHASLPEPRGAPNVCMCECAQREVTTHLARYHVNP